MFLLRASKGGVMIEQSLPGETLTPARDGLAFLCLHGHFYQPPREDPFTHTLPLEPGAAPFANFNEKITAECYRPNAEAGNFDAISFNLGPTLAAWMQQAQPDVYQRIIAADHHHMQRYGVGNAIAQVYNHTIMPLATTRDKITQIRWGLQDFHQRYGHAAHGMWLAETAVDIETLDLLAQHGITYTILAPWQTATPIVANEPYIIPLHHGRSITAFFYNGPLSGGVSFDWNTTNDANVFASSYVPGHLVESKLHAGEAQLITIATDGELYGHHKPWRDKFLSHLINYGAPEHGFEVCTPERYMLMHPARKEVKLHEPSAWSCAHGVARWNTGCDCTEGHSDWKGPLRHAVSHLNEQANRLYEQKTSETLHDPWAARDDYMSLRNGWITQEEFWSRHGKSYILPSNPEQVRQTEMLLEAQYYQQYSFTSCGWFFEDLARIEPSNNINFARRAISLIWQATSVDLQTDFLKNLQAGRSWRTRITGAQMYRELPAVPQGQLPPFPDK